MTTYNTGNPIGSAAVKDLYDNAENLDTAINSPTSDTWTDRLGVERPTWRGIDARANVQIERASDAADLAELARDDARAAAVAAGPIKFYGNYAQAQADIGNRLEGDTVEVSQDETRAGARTRYKVQSGALSFVLNLDQIRLDLAAPSGASLIGHGGQTAGEVLDGLTANQATFTTSLTNLTDRQNKLSGAIVTSADTGGALKVVLKTTLANTAVGEDALTRNDNAGHNVAIGNNAAKSLKATAGQPLQQGVGNTVVGADALSAPGASCDYTSAFGYLSLAANTIGYCNSAFGLRTLTANTTGTYNTALGTDALMSNTTANENTAVGAKALYGNTTGAGNTSIGISSLMSNVSGSENVVIGGLAALASTNASNNVAVGYRALELNDTWTNNTALGWWALRGCKSAGNVGIGARALVNLGSGGSNIGIGQDAGGGITSGIFNLAIGRDSLTTSGNVSNATALGYASQVTGDNQVQLGNSSTTTYVFGTVQNRSDTRDKADVEDSELGLDFIMGLRPVSGRWDMREDYIETVTRTRTEMVESRLIDESGKPLLVPAEVEYEEKIVLPKDGSKKRNRRHQWFLAPEVKALCDRLGVDFGGFQDHSLSGGKDVMTLGYDEFIPPIVKAIHAIKARQDDFGRRLAALELQK